MVRHEEPVRKENLRGGEGHVVLYPILSPEELMGHGTMYARVVIPPHCSIGWHQHVGNTEPYYILKGEGKVIYDGEELPLSAGMCHYCPNGHTHSLINNSGGALEFFAVVPLK